MLNTILIDNERSALSRLQILLSHECADMINIVDQCRTVEAAIAAIDAHKPDLIFLDIQLGSQTGFDLLGGIAAINFDVIFVTAHDEFALRAFQADAVDYLLKPIDADKLKKAVSKVVARSLRDRSEHQNKLTEAVYNRDRPITKIGIPTSNGRLFINIQDIVYCKSDGGYTKFIGLVEKGRENLLGMATDSLSKFEEALKNSNFCRIHDSHIINMAYLKAYVNGRGGQVKLMDGTELNVSEGRKAEFKRRIQGDIF